MQRVYVGMILTLCFLSPVFGDTKSEIAAILQSQDQAWNRGDMDGFLSAYDRTGELVFVGSSGVVRDWNILKEHYEKKYKSGNADYGRLSFSDLQVEELAKGLARAWGRWQVAQKESTSSGWFSLLLRKTRAGWRIIHDHSS